VNKPPRRQTDDAQIFERLHGNEKPDDEREHAPRELAHRSNAHASAGRAGEREHAATCKGDHVGLDPEERREKVADEYDDENGHANMK